MTERFKNLPIGTKLMITAALFILFFLSLFTYLVTSFTSSIIEKNSLAELKNQAELVKNIVEVFSNNIKKNTVELSNVFVSYFPDRFALDPSRHVDIGGRSTPVLKNGNGVLNLNYATIDRFSHMTGAIATVFVRQGDDFVRITTSLKKQDGSRAIGTVLGKNHPGYASLIKGERYLGRATLFGKTYSTQYVPIKDSSGEAIGILFVGLDITDSLNFLKEKIKSIRIGETGYIYAINGEPGEGYGTMTIHPVSEGKDIGDFKDASGAEFYKEILKNKTGTVKYMWLNKERGETTPREKLAAYTYFDDWKWVIVAGAYLDELNKETIVLKRYLYAASFIIIISLLFALYIASRRLVTLPLRNGVAFARSVAEGNLTETLEVHRSDEIGELFGALNGMVGSLNGMVSKVDTSAGDLSNISRELTGATASVVEATQVQALGITETSSAVSEISTSLTQVARWIDNLSRSAAESSSSIMEMSSSNEEVALNMDTLSRSVEEVSSSIIQMSSNIRQVSGGVATLMDASTTTASSVNEMDCSIRQVQTNATETAGITDRVRRDAEDGKVAVEATISGINGIRRSAKITSEVIATLSERASDIGAILAVIVDVTEQTNLLALNAAIIAAQAGEHGKGFAVVADEIKQLAERTRTSTHEIDQVIRGVQNETQRAVEAMTMAEKSITEGEELSANAGAILHKIVTEAQQASAQMAEIALATVEQARGSQSIRDAMEQVAELVEQFATASKEQAHGSEQIITAVERMKQLSFQVRNSTQEQSKGGALIAQSTENITGMIQQIKRAIDEQSRGSEQIAAAAGNIQQSAEVNLDTTAIMDKASTSLARQVEILRQEMKTFQV